MCGDLSVASTAVFALENICFISAQAKDSVFELSRSFSVLSLGLSFGSRLVVDVDLHCVLLDNQTFAVVFLSHAVT